MKKLKRLGRQRRYGSDFWAPERAAAKKKKKKKNPSGKSVYEVKTWATGHRRFRSKAAARRYAQGLANKTGSSVHVSEKGTGRGGALDFEVWPSKANPGVKMQKNTPKGWIKAKAVKIVRKHGKKVVLVKR